MCSLLQLPPLADTEQTALGLWELLLSIFWLVRDACCLKHSTHHVLPAWQTDLDPLTAWPVLRLTFPMAVIDGSEFPRAVFPR